MRVMVTGATGQIGTVVVARLAAAGHEVLPRSLRSTRPDDPALTAIDAVVHLGAQTNAYTARADIGRDIRDSVVPFVELLGAIGDSDRPPLVVLAGTVTQATGPERHSPSTFYDVAKSASQLYLEQAAAEGWVRAVTLRLANVYGGTAQAGHRHPRGFLNACIARALAQEPITVYGNGAQLRDYLHVDDLADLVTSVVTGPPPALSAQYDVGSGTSIPLIDAVQLVVQQVALVTGQRTAIEHQPWPGDASPIERRSASVETGPVREAYAWRPTMSLADGIMRTIRTFTTL